MASASSSTDGQSPAQLVELHRIDDVPALVGDLANLARDEGFGMLDRLVTDWRSGHARFDAPGERLLIVRSGAAVVAVGGVTRDPWAPAHAGRIRRLYVAPSHRRAGIGTMLLDELVRGARSRFGILRLRTHTERGAAFFEAHGFRRVAEPEATHAMSLWCG